MALSLKFDPNTIQHLGVKMYSTLPPALAELISNAYDADADDLMIEFHEQNGTPISITITDNGHGMSLTDIQEKFLVIGRNRRILDGDTPSSKYKRLPTGKKGLGKLALFGLAKKITIDTIKENKRNRFHLNWDELLSSSVTYNPKIDLSDADTKNSAKTIIQLSDLKRKSSFDLDAIADSLSKIFIVDETFKIKLKGPNNKEITIKNENRYSSISPQFTWTEKDLIEDDHEYHGKIIINLITSQTPIPPSSGLRGVALFSRGKLVNAPEYFSDSTSSHFFQYLTGQITADFIDLLDEDVISTNRQSLNWEHTETSKLRGFLSKIISEVGQDWRKQRALKKDKELEITTGVNKEAWLKTLPEGIKNSVSEIIKSMGEGEDVSESFAPIVKALHNIVPEYPLLHWRHLHPKIKQVVYEYYINKQYGHAADQGAKMYAELLRKISGLDLDGTKLADLFGTDKATGKPKISINSLETESLKNIQEGQGHLTRGLMQAFRNPIGHGPMNVVVPNLISELDCLNILSLVSYLTTKVDIPEESQHI